MNASRLGLAAAFVSGALPALAFPAPSWWWLAWFGVVPLLLVVRAAPTARTAALRVWCGMAGYILATQYWLLPSAGPLLLVLAIGLGALWLPWGLAAFLLLREPRTVGRTFAAMAVLPSAWVVAEAVRSWPSLGGQWALLGASQWNQPATLASASLGGVWLTSFLIVAANTAVVAVILNRHLPVRLVAAAVALGACAAVGPAWFWLGPAPPTGPTVRVALVQPGNIEDSAARQAAGEALTEHLRGRRLDLVVWGESSVGVDLAGDRDAVARLAGLSGRVGADLLVNVDARDRTGEISKSSVLIGAEGVRGTYSKTRLVPFGEYVPLRPLFGWATRHTKAAAEDRRRGSGILVLQTQGIALGPLISFETTFSDLPRELVARDAQLLVYQSSTSTYQGSWAQPQLASMVAVHAAEVGHPAVHTGLSGVSSAFDARGRQLGWYAATESGVLVVEVPLGSHTTTFQRFGNWVLAMALSILACGIAVATRRYRVARHTTRRAR